MNFDCKNLPIEVMGKACKNDSTRNILGMAVTQIAILVCSKFTAKISANLSQVWKCETSLQQVNASLKITIGRTCSKLALQTIAKTQYERPTTQDRTLETYRFGS
ncbi:hypothetical protein AVEN_252274-1 [Araneus ventricosus]|uniref:Uncharacterized protein n=1 Tax=Araneus ventricosus TaxID=182803 RepID=A0A4Y2WRD8_ARAVE|nr:hypothetical protein AVEN_252274-1 [Araneus ventricosus]